MPQLFVLYIIDDFHSVSQTFVRNEIAALRARGVKVATFSLHPTGCQPDSPAIQHPTTRALLRAGGRLCLTQRGRALLKKALSGPWGRSQSRQLFALLVARHIAAYHPPPDHIHAHFFGRCSDIAYYLQRLLHVPYSVTGHAGDVLAPLNDCLLRRNASDAAGLVAASEIIARQLRAIAPTAKPNRTITVRIGIASEILAQPTAASTLPHDNEPIRLVTVARLVPKKGFDAIVAAAVSLRERGVPFVWRIAGDGPLKSSIFAALTRAHLAGSVELLGPCTHVDALALIREAHAFVLPCIRTPDGDSDGLPAVLIEALALGTPVVTTATGAIPELVRHEHTGLIVPESDGLAVADAIERLRSTPRLYACLAERGRKLTSADYVLEKQIARLHNFFLTLSDESQPDLPPTPPSQA